jgi:protein KTI12
MALITISGFPCSGKTLTAHRLRDDLEARLGEPSYTGPRLKVIVVDDDSCHVPRSTYDGTSDR